MRVLQIITNIVTYEVTHVQNTTFILYNLGVHDTCMVHNGTHYDEKKYNVQICKHLLALYLALLTLT